MTAGICPKCDAKLHWEGEYGLCDACKVKYANQLAQPTVKHGTPLGYIPKAKKETENGMPI